MKNKPTIEQIDALLPQTQCGLCDYDGCKPYAEAIVQQGENIDRCPPGGVDTLNKLAEITEQDATPMIADMKQKQKTVMVAIIREDACIGCTKCIQACPTDAIVGAAKLMHTVITNDCTGCELCILPCPVDCIDMVVIPEPDSEQRQQRANKFRQKYQKRNQRLEKMAAEKKQKHQRAKLKTQQKSTTLAARRDAIAQAVARAKAKKAYIHSTSD